MDQHESASTGTKRCDFMTLRVLNPVTLGSKEGVMGFPPPV